MSPNLRGACQWQILGTPPTRRLLKGVTRRRHLINLASELKSRSVELESLTENIETRSPTRKLVFHVFVALAEFERNLIREFPCPSNRGRFKLKRRTSISRGMSI